MKFKGEGGEFCFSDLMMDILLNGFRSRDLSSVDFFLLVFPCRLYI